MFVQVPFGLGRLCAGDELAMPYLEVNRCHGDLCGVLNVELIQCADQFAERADGRSIVGEMCLPLGEFGADFVGEMVEVFVARVDDGSRAAEGTETFGENFGELLVELSPLSEELRERFDLWE